MVLKDSIGIRTVSKATKRFFSSIGSIVRVPSHSTLSRWFKRLGLYKLEKPLEKSDDWIGIVDASIAVGDKKCLVILGIRQKTYLEIIQNKRALVLEDVQPLHVELAKTINSQLVCEAFKKAETRIGAFRQTCGDGGSDIVGGISLFQKYAKQQGRVIKHVYDITHKLACLIKAKFEQDSEWKEFTASATASKNKFQLGEFSHLCPPNQRSKSRFMNMEQLMTWASEVLAILNNPTNPAHKVVSMHFSWIKKHEETIQVVSEIIKIAQEVRHKIRTEGITPTTYSELRENFMNQPTSSTRVSDFCGEILDFFENICNGIGPQDCLLLLGTSEIIETLFGKLKTMIREDLKKGFTGSVLFVAACAGTIDRDEVKNAMTLITDQDVKNWVQKNIGETFTQKRRKCLGFNKKKPGRKKKQEQINVEKENIYQSEIKPIGEIEKEGARVHKSGVNEGARISTTGSRNASENHEPSYSEVNAQPYEQNPEDKEWTSGKVASVCGVTEQKDHAHQSMYEGTLVVTTDPRDASENHRLSCSEVNEQSYERIPENKGQMYGKVEQEGYVRKSMYKDISTSTADSRNVSENKPSCSEQNSKNKERMFGKVESILVIEQKGPVHESVYEGTPISTTDPRYANKNNRLSYSEINVQQKPENKEQMLGKVESVWVIEQQGHVHKSVYEGAQEWGVLGIRQGKNIRVKWDKNRPELSDEHPREIP